jgi:hypothetical protein
MKRWGRRCPGAVIGENKPSSYSRNYSKSYSCECLTIDETLIRGIRLFG